MNNSITTTNLKRKNAFWFLILTPSAIVLLSLFSNISEVNIYNIINAYLIFCFSVLTTILGTKANDTIQKFKMEKVNKTLEYNNEDKNNEYNK